MLRRYSFGRSSTLRRLRDAGGTGIILVALAGSFSSDTAFLLLLPAAFLWRRCVGALDPAGAVLLFSEDRGWRWSPRPDGDTSTAALTGSASPPSMPALRCRARPGAALWLQYDHRDSILVFRDALDDAQWRDLRHTLRVHKHRAADDQG